MTNRDLRFAQPQHSERIQLYDLLCGSVTGALSVYEDFTMYTLRHRLGGWSCLCMVRTPKLSKSGLVSTSVHRGPVSVGTVAASVIV